MAKIMLTVLGIVIPRDNVRRYLESQGLPTEGPRASLAVREILRERARCKQLLRDVAAGTLLASPLGNHGTLAYTEILLRQYFELPIPDQVSQIGEKAMATHKKTDAVRKKATKAQKSNGKGGGVIKTILATMARDKGATKEEIVNVLAKKFPDREPESMASTVSIQTSQLAKRDGVKITKEKDQRRGLVYYAKVTGAAKEMLAA